MNERLDHTITRNDLVKLTINYKQKSVISQQKSLN